MSAEQLPTSSRKPQSANRERSWWIVRARRTAPHRAHGGMAQMADALAVVFGSLALAVDATADHLRERGPRSRGDVCVRRMPVYRQRGQSAGAAGDRFGGALAAILSG